MAGITGFAFTAEAKVAMPMVVTSNSNPSIFLNNLGTVPPLSWLQDRSICWCFGNQAKSDIC